MNDLGRALALALELIARRDEALIEIVLLSLRVSLTASVLAFLAGTALGVAFGFWFARSPALSAVFDPYLKIGNALPRVVLAIAPHLAGVRFQPSGSYGEQLHSVFYGTGKYERNLFLSRIGNLLFFAIASVALGGVAR